jgi:hypothetical protein
MKLTQKITALLFSVIAPVAAFCQVVPPDPGDNANNPDVPFDSNMNIAFLVVGLLFASFIVYKELQRRRRLAGK